VRLEIEPRPDAPAVGDLAADGATLFFTAAEGASDAIGAIRAVRDAAGNHVGDEVVYLNATVRGRWLGGAPLDSVVGCDPYELIPAIGRLRELSRHVVATREPHRTIVELPRPGGPSAWIDQRLEAWGDGFLFFSRDVTSEHVVPAVADAAGVDGNALVRDALSALGDSVSVWRAVRDEEGRLVDALVQYANPAWRRVMLGSDEIDPAGMRLVADLPSLAGRLELHREVIDTRVPQRTVLELAGTGKWFDEGYVRFGDGLIVVSRDVTDATLARDRLATREAALAEAQRIAHAGSWTLDAATGAITWSDELYRIFGHEPGSPVSSMAAGAPWYSSETLAERDEAVARSLATGDPFEIEYDITRTDGATRHLVARGEAVRDGTGAVTGLRGTVADVTERWLAEAAVRASEGRFRTTIETLIDPLVVMHAVRDEAGAIVDFVYDYANDAACAANRKPRERLVGERLLTVAPAHGPSGLFAAYAAVVSTGEPLVGDGLIFDVQGGNALARRFLDVRASRMGDAVVVTWRDVTHQRELAETVARAARAESVGRLAGGVAHDFNNLLGVIAGNVEFLEERLPPGDPGHADIAAIREASSRAVALTRQLLAFGRRQALRQSIVDVGDIVAGLEPMLRSLVPADINLAVDVAAPAGRVRVDPGQLEQAIVNLVLNARDATTGAGRITVTADRATYDAGDPRLRPSRPPGPYVRVIISDTGSGIDASALPHIFEPFYTTKAAGLGSGLGLSSVEGAVVQSGGFVTVRSEVGHGSAFSIHLPETLEEPGDVPALQVRQLPAISPGGTETILLVEDEPGIRAMTARTLRDLGYGVIEADDPAGALGIVATAPGSIDLLVTDVVMPGMSGRDLAVELVSREPGLPVLFISGYIPESASGGTLLDAGSEVLPKPFGRAVLATRVRELLDRRAREDPPRGG
jgi:PAS domain S-box-containing protein